MTVTIELKPEIEERIRSEAAALGVPVEDYIESVIESQLSDWGREVASENSTPADRARAWEVWAASHNPDTPVILDDSREALYGDDGR
jgi:hypothetical protein